MFRYGGQSIYEPHFNSHNWQAYDSNSTMKTIKCNNCGSLACQLIGGSYLLIEEFNKFYSHNRLMCNQIIIKSIL